MKPVQRVTFYTGASAINVILFYIANGIHFGVDRMLGKNMMLAKRQAKGMKGP